MQTLNGNITNINFLKKMLLKICNLCVYSINLLQCRENCRCLVQKAFESISVSKVGICCPANLDNQKLPTVLLPTLASCLSNKVTFLIYILKEQNLAKLKYVYQL